MSEGRAAARTAAASAPRRQDPPEPAGTEPHIRLAHWTRLAPVSVREFWRFSTGGRKTPMSSRPQAGRFGTIFVLGIFPARAALKR